MSAIRKLATHSIKSIARNGFKAPVITRSMSSLLDGKEHAEEARYIRNLEETRKAELRANLERIMALEDHHEEKTNLVELLDKKEKAGFFAKFGLDDFKIGLPMALAVGMPLLSNEIMVIDAETQLGVCFLLFAGTFYNQVGGMLNQTLTDYSSEVEKDLRAVDDQIKSSLESAIIANTAGLSVEEEYVAFNELKDNLRVIQAEVLTNQEAHNYRDAIVKKLESLNALEESASHAIRQRMITKVQADVLDTFKNDRKAKDNALNQAIAVLAGGANAKMGKDIVGELFSASLVNYKDAYAKMPAGSDAILTKLEADMAAVAAAPVLDSKGGNVYITHPL